MTQVSLLPSNATPLERALAKASTRFDHAEVVKTLWNPATCPESVLPFLAWALSVDEWDPMWSLEKKRAVCVAARALHRKKATPYAIRTALAALGQPDAKIVERSSYIRCDGSVICNGDHSCGGQWATYTITLYRPVTVPDAYLIKRLLQSVGRMVVHLESITFQAAAFRCDGTIVCNGDYTCGAVNTTIN